MGVFYKSIFDHTDKHNIWIICIMWGYWIPNNEENIYLHGYNKNYTLTKVNTNSHYNI